MELTFILVTMALLYFHWVGDFVFQTRYMAENKSQSFKVLSLHCLLYSVTMAIGLMWINIFVAQDVMLLKVIYFFGLIFALHFVTDAVTSRMTTKYYTSGRTKKFWMTIGFDQWFHTLQILIIYWIVT